MQGPVTTCCFQKSNNGNHLKIVSHGVGWPVNSSEWNCGAVTRDKNLSSWAKLSPSATLFTTNDTRAAMGWNPWQ